MPTLKLPYDQAVFEATLPDTANVRTLAPKPMRAIDDPHGAYLSALESPISSPMLGELANGVTGRILIIVTDHTRVSGKERTLPWLLDVLNDYGIPDDRINILMAFGSHDKPSEEKFRATIGPALDRVIVYQHDTSGPMIDCGTTSFGTQVWVNTKLKEADLVILCSSVVHHYFAGYGGGRKILVPGIASLDTISANHSLVFWEMEGKSGRNPGVKSGILDGNPVHEDMLESARLALGDQPCFSIVTVMTPDKEFSYFTAGEMDESHRRACEFIDSYNFVDIDRKADLIIASAGGYPKDINVIQSHKGMDNVCHGLLPGGTLLYLMSCSDGYGHWAIEEFAPLDQDRIRTRLAEKYVVYGQTIYAIKEKSCKFRIVLITNLDPGWTKSVGIEPASNLDEALNMIRDEINSSEIIYHIPRADLTIPRAPAPG